MAIFFVPFLILGVESPKVDKYIPGILQSIVHFICGLGFLILSIIIFLTKTEPGERVFIYSAGYVRFLNYTGGFFLSMFSFVLAIKELL